MSNWFKSEGYLDLAEFCGYKPVSCDLRKETKERSLKQEYYFKDIFVQCFDKVLYQQCIKYKKEDEEEKFCILDFICSKGGYVFIFDCKLSAIAFDDEKAELYLSVLRNVMDRNDDVRKLVFFYAADAGLGEVKSKFGILLSDCSVIAEDSDSVNFLKSIL